MYAISKTLPVIRAQSSEMIIHYMKKTIYIDLIKEDLSDLKRVCMSLPIDQKKLDSIEKKYSKSRYVLSDFWNSYFKSKKAESQRLIRRKTMPQSMIDHQEMRVHSRSENYSLITVENESGKVSHGLDNSLIISMKIREELKAVQSEIPGEDKDSLHGHLPREGPIKATLFNSSKTENTPIRFSLEKENSQKKTMDTKSRLSHEKDQADDKRESFDFIDRNSPNSSRKISEKQKEEESRMMHQSDLLTVPSNNQVRASSTMQRYKTSKSARTIPQGAPDRLFTETSLPVHAFIKKKAKRKRKGIKKKDST